MEQPQQQLDELEWRSPEWINVHGLRTDNVLEYLSESPFWDRQCSNQQLKMQRGGTIPIPTVDPELTRMRGVEYVLVLAREPDLWVVRKQWRSGDGNGDSESGNNTTPLADYYIVGARVYMSPRVGDVLRASCLGIAESLRVLSGVDTGVVDTTDTDAVDAADATDTTATTTATATTTTTAVLPGGLLKTALSSTSFGTIDA